MLPTISIVKYLKSFLSQWKSTLKGYAMNSIFIFTNTNEIENGEQRS